MIAALFGIVGLIVGLIAGSIAGMVWGYTSGHCDGLDHGALNEAVPIIDEAHIARAYEQVAQDQRYRWAEDARRKPN